MPSSILRLIIILRNAKEKSIDLGRTYFIGNEQEILNTRQLDYVVNLYVKNWIDNPKARAMLGEFFGVEME